MWYAVTPSHVAFSSCRFPLSCVSGIRYAYKEAKETTAVTIAKVGTKELTNSLISMRLWRWRPIWHGMLSMGFFEPWY